MVGQGKLPVVIGTISNAANSKSCKRQADRYIICHAEPYVGGKDTRTKTDGILTIQINWPLVANWVGAHAKRAKDPKLMPLNRSTLHWWSAGLGSARLEESPASLLVWRWLLVSRSGGMLRGSKLADPRFTELHVPG
jgi:hypothetical protein